MPKNMANYTDVNSRMKLAADTWQTIVVSPPVILTDVAGYVTATIILKDGRSVTEIAAFRLGLTGQSAQATFPIEDAATSAVGRALGRFGFGTDTHFPSREEMEQVERVQSQPQPRQQEARRQAPSAEHDAEWRRLAGELRDIRQQLTAIGGTVVSLTSSQVERMSPAELTALIAQTRADLEDEQQRLTVEASQTALVEP